MHSNGNNNEELGYDPANMAAMIVLVIFGLAILFWMFWSLLVFKGGILIKVWMLIKIITGQKCFSAINPKLWDGWVINVGALGFLLFFIAGIRFLFRKAAFKK